MMAGKAGMGNAGRLTFSGRQEYVARMFAIDGTTYWLPIARCELGNHYLMRDERGQIVERTFTDGDVTFSFGTLTEAQAAIEQWHRQHAAAVANSGETPQEG